MPMLSAMPSSLSLMAGSKVAAWNISNSLIALEGIKFAPTSHGCCLYQSLAFWADHRSGEPFVDCAVLSGIAAVNSDKVMSETEQSRERLKIIRVPFVRNAPPVPRDTFLAVIVPFFRELFVSKCFDENTTHYRTSLKVERDARPGVIPVAERDARWGFSQPLRDW